VKSIV